MLMAALDCCPCCERKHEQRKAKFCSQVVARVLQDAGILPQCPPCNEYLPRDFGLMWGGTKEWSEMHKKLGRLRMLRRPKNEWTGLNLR
jgi:hypothetical protein